MGFGRRLQFASVHDAAAPPVSGSWQWHGSALDSTGGNMTTNYDGTTWYTGVDIAGVARLTSLAEGTVVQWQQGRGIKSGNLDVQSGKVAAMTSNGTTAWALGGVAPGGGAIHSRDIAGGGIWQMETANYFGDVSGPIGVGRPTGHRRIYHDTATNAVYVCCQRASDYNGGIARKVGSGSFTDFDAANGFTIGRMYRAVVGSTAGFPDTLYACANSAIGDASSTGYKPCVAIYTSASTSTPHFMRLDTIGTGNPGGLLDAQDMICINENDQDALYVLVGEGDSVNGGLWRCTIQGDPTSSSWQSSPALTWTKLNNSVLAPAHSYRTLTGQRVGSATYIMVGNNPSSGSVPSLSGTIPNQTSKFVAAVYRSLNAHTDTPAWEAITDLANIAPGGSYYPTFGTVDEVWVQLTGSQGASSNKSVLGGSSWNAYDMDIDPANQTIVVAGKSGSWITQNPWAATAASVKWQQFSNSTGGVINTAIYIHPSDNTKWTMTDVDRAGYYNLNGGLGQMHGIEKAFGTTCHANFIRQGGSAPGRWLLGDDTGIIHISDNWTTTTNPNVVPTFVNNTVTGAGALCAVSELTYNAVDYRLALDGSGGLFVKAGSGAWSKAYSFGAVYGSTSTFIVNDGYKD
ncbi:MAG TPA: hypothetical protein VFL85_02715, partial [Candidatus Saccharimonadales bacterium]|nr:hypothetical protein [Candidatus Saccharimonadales bacterium]